MICLHSKRQFPLFYGGGAALLTGDCFYLLALKIFTQSLLCVLSTHGRSSPRIRYLYSEVVQFIRLYHLECISGSSPFITLCLKFLHRLTARRSVLSMLLKVTSIILCIVIMKMLAATTITYHGLLKQHRRLT